MILIERKKKQQQAQKAAQIKQQLEAQKAAQIQKQLEAQKAAQIQKQIEAQKAAQIKKQEDVQKNIQVKQNVENQQIVEQEKINKVSEVKNNVNTLKPVVNSTNNVTINENSSINDILKANGIGEVQISAIVQNLERESSLNPNADNGVGNQGLAQWGGSRLESLKSTCNGLGTMQCQVKFMINEMKSGINGFNMSEFNQINNVSQANQYFKSSYEGAA